MSGMIDMCDWSERHLWLDSYVWKCQIQIRQINRLPYGRYISCMHTFIKQKNAERQKNKYIISVQIWLLPNTGRRESEKHTPSTLQTDSRSPDASAAGRIIQPGNTNKVPEHDRSHWKALLHDIKHYIVSVC